MRSFPNWIVLMKTTKNVTVVGSVSLVDFQTRIVFRKTTKMYTLKGHE